MPRGLRLLLAVALIEGLAWICVLPPMQGPDEVSHFAYVQKMVEARTIPWTTLGLAPDPQTRPYSDELAAALAVAGVSASWANISGRPAGTDAEERSWEREENRFGRRQRDDGGFTSAMRYPPLYYLYVAIPYLALYPASIFDRAFAMRLANLPLLLAVVALTWLVAGELLGGRPLLQVVATAAVALHPQLTHATAVVNPDIFLAAVWAGALYVMIRLVKAGPSRGRLLWLAALCPASGLAHLRGLALILPAAVAVGLAYRRHLLLKWRLSPRLELGGAALLCSFAVAFAIYAATLGDPSASRVRQFASYVWQFYLPRLRFMQPSISPGWGVRQVFVDRFFGGFAQLEVELPPHLALTLWRATLIAAVLAIVGLVAYRRAARRSLDAVLVCGITILGYLGFLHVVAFRSLLGGPDPILTGRYLLTLMPLYGSGLALAMAWLPRRVAPIAAACLLVGLAFLQLAALGLVFQRFYA